MHGPFANSRLAVSLRRLRGRFGISAPRVAVRPHVPWYLLALRSILVLGLALAFAGWMYDVGRRFAGFDRHESEQELTTLRAKLEAAEEELAQLRKQANGSQTSLEIERTAQKQISEQAKTLESENSKLKEETAVLENLLAGGSKGTNPGVARLSAESVGGGLYRYHLLLTSGSGQNERPVEGEIHVTHLVVNGTVIGPIHSAEFLELQTKARVTGDAEYNAIEIHLGAVIQGRLIHQAASAKAAVELKLAASQ